MDRQEQKHAEGKDHASLRSASGSGLPKPLPVGILILDRDRKCTQVNAAASEMLGYAEADVLGQDLHLLLHNAASPFVRAVSDGADAQNAEESLRTRSGDVLHVFGSTIPLTLRGEHVGSVVTVQNESLQVYLSEQLTEAQNEQAEVLRQRDAAARVERELAEENAMRQRNTAVAMEKAAAEQLRMQQRMAEDRLLQSEKLAAVGRLAASISHEINNPLEAVTNLLYLVRHDASISREANEYLEQAEAELARVSQIVSQTLRFQRSGTSPVTISPDTLIDSVVSLHQGRLHHRGIQIDRRHRSPRPFLCAEGDLRQILNNLVSNAIEAMGKDGGTLTIRTTPARDVQSGAPGLRVSVADTGHGMAQQTALQIFEPFYTTKGASGSGLGLWISSTLAKRHGGRLSVRSRTGGGARGGTTFSLFLPETVVEAGPRVDGEPQTKAA